jgi:DNA polymerase-1
MQVNAFAGHMGWPVERAAAAHAQWFNTFSGIRDFQNQAKNVFKKRGYVKTILGRRARLDDYRFAYRATSRIIQGSNADILKERMLAVDEHLESEGDQTHLLMTVHDSLEWQSPKGEIGQRQSAEIREIACRVQQEPYNLRVPFVMDMGSGINWAEATYGPEK